MTSFKDSESDFNVIQFEKRLTALKDSQDHINACCKWCLENRQHHKKIVTSWLNVLKRVKIEQRVNLFYLANDVIQYSKRRNYDFVESWGTALQKATTLVRDDKVKHKIIRIFNIWEQRGVYNEEFISDLCGLISVVPTASKNDEPHEFQSSYVINKIKHCSKLENETDIKLKVLKEHNPKIQLESDSMCTSLKDRAHVDDVEKEVDVYVKHLEGYINALKAEIKCRIANISVLKQASGHLDKDKRDVKVVANAYKTFGQRVKTFQKKLEEHKITLISPIPSPDINAPSPSPDLDIDLPGDDISASLPYNPAQQFGYYNPLSTETTTSSSNFVTNGFSSFIGSNFNLNTTNSLFTNTQTTTQVTSSGNYDLCTTNILQLPPKQTDSLYQNNHMQPLLPPPMPPFSSKADYDNSYNAYNEKNNFDLPPPYPPPPPNDSATFYDQSQSNNQFNRNDFTNQPPPTTGNPYSTPTTISQSIIVNNNNNDNSEQEYNPEQEPDNWDNDWLSTESTQLDDTPESPPLFEKKAVYNEPIIEYHDNNNTNLGIVDVDHRILHPIPAKLDNLRGRGKDVDHRNLISLTGSPADTISTQEKWHSLSDQDYRTPQNQSVKDQDYRISSFNLEQLILPPPPPPPATSLKNKQSPRKLLQDNVESIDMELSEDETDLTDLNRGNNENLKVLIDGNTTLMPPPPLPDLPDDVDANCFLDDLSNDLNSNNFSTNLENNSIVDQQNYYNMPPPPPPPHHQPPSMMNNWNNLPPPPPPPPLPFRGRGNRGNFGNSGGNGGGGGGNRGMNRGRGARGMFRGGNNFRGRGRGPNRNNNRQRGNFRGNFQGGF